MKMSSPNAASGAAKAADRPADAAASNWVDRFAPRFAVPYLRLMRADRPIGWWLLLWPCWWSLALAGGGYQDWKLYLLFWAGAVIMRGAGCVLNDIADRDFDAKVEGTRARPIPSGAVSVSKAVIFMIALALAGLVILLQLSRLAIWLGVGSLLLIVIYPFMKRFTYWPQIFLGLAFNWGAVMGWAAMRNSLSAAPVVLYLGGILWTLGYDTIYAHQDKADDLIVGVKSTALKLGNRTKTWLWVFYGGAALLILSAGWLANSGVLFYPVMVFAAAHLISQIVTLDIDQPESCLVRFRANRSFGWIVFAAVLLGQIRSVSFGV